MNIDEKLFVLKLAFGYARTGCTGCTYLWNEFREKIESAGAGYENAQNVERAFQLIGLSIDDIDEKFFRGKIGALISRERGIYLNCQSVDMVIDVVKRLLEEGDRGE